MKKLLFILSFILAATALNAQTIDISYNSVRNAELTYSECREIILTNVRDSAWISEIKQTPCAIDNAKLLRATHNQVFQYGTTYWELRFRAKNKHIWHVFHMTPASDKLMLIGYGVPGGDGRVRINIDRPYRIFYPGTLIITDFVAAWMYDPEI